MSLAIKHYTHVPMHVHAVQVTAENIAEVAAWCEGVINSSSETYIKVATIKPLRDRQTQAFIGDWVIKTGFGFKVYKNKAFGFSFVESPEPVKN